MQRTLSHSDVQVRDSFEKAQRSFRLDRILSRALHGTVFDPTRLEKLPSSFTARSARAVVPPLQFLRHPVSAFLRE